jgi:hypothetical protein
MNAIVAFALKQRILIAILLAPILILIVLPVAIDIFSQRSHTELADELEPQPAE